MSLDELEKLVRDTLSEKRFYHSKCVQKRCEELARIYNFDIEKASKVGIVHDFAKEMPVEQMLEYVECNHMLIDEVERKNTGLLHGKIAAHMASEKFGFSEDMVEAVAYHTTGKPNMGMLAKILFVADATGEDRNWEDLELVRKRSETDLDWAIVYIIELNIRKNIERGNLIHPDSILARNSLLVLRQL